MRLLAAVGFSCLLAPIFAFVLLESIFMTLAAVLAIVVLAGINAWAALAPARAQANVVGQEQVSYLRWFFKVEVFWRAFITNLSFGGVSLSLGAIAFQSKWGFWDLNNPILPLMLNFVMGLLVPYELKETEEPPSRWAWWVIGFGLVFYFYAGWSAYTLYKPPV